MDAFLEPLTPQQAAIQNAMVEVKEEMGELKKKLRAEIRSLKRKRADELVPSIQAVLDEQIPIKEQEFAELDCAYVNASTASELALQKHVRGLIKWDEKMRKHGVSGY